MRRSRIPSPRAALWLAAYGACVLLVMSFITFEILDVDGSDVASPTRTASATSSTDPPEDLRRAPLPATPVALVVPPADAYAHTLRVVHRVETVRLNARPHPSLRHSSRTTLARGLLADLLLSA